MAGFDGSFHEQTIRTQQKSSAGFSRKGESMQSLVTPPLELEKTQATAFGTQTRPNFLHEIHVDREGHSTSIKRALRMKKMAKKLKAFTATAASLKPDAYSKKEKEMTFLSKTYVTSNPLEFTELSIPLKEKPIVRRHKSKK